MVEVRSPGDETYDKIGWYAAAGVREMLIVHSEGRASSCCAPSAAGSSVSAGADGVLHSEVLDITRATVDEQLVITWNGGNAQI